MKSYADKMREVTEKANEAKLINQRDEMRDIYDRIRKAAENGEDRIEISGLPSKQVCVLTNDGFSVDIFIERTDPVTRRRVCDLAITWGCNEKNKI